MSTPEHQEKLKEEAKAIRTRLDTLIKDTDIEARVIRMLCVYAGMITETLIEFEEPDVVMEQAFHRIADLLRTDPDDGDTVDALMPPPYKVDHDTELGRQLGRAIAKKVEDNTILLAVGSGEGEAGAQRNVAADDSPAPIKTILRIEDVHRSAFSARRTSLAPH